MMLVLHGCPQSKEGPQGKDAKSKRAHHKRPSRHLQADLFVFVCDIATMPTCAGKAMSLKKAVACVQHTEIDIVLAMHMGNAVTENKYLVAALCCWQEQGSIYSRPDAHQPA